MDWIEDNSPRALTLARIQGAANGINGSFHITPVPPTGILLFVNGIFQISGIAYTLVGSAITFAPEYRPQFGDPVEAVIQGEPL